MGKKDSASAMLVIAAKLADFANLNAAVMSFLPFDAGFSPAGIDDGSVASDRSRRCDVSHTIVDWDESQITAANLNAGPIGAIQPGASAFIPLSTHLDRYL